MTDEPVIPESFADYPRSVGDIRAERSQRASDWSPRDALISLLRDIDSGEIEIESLVIAFSTVGNPDDLSSRTSHYRSAVRNPHEAYGLLEAVKLRMFLNGRRG